MKKCNLAHINPSFPRRASILQKKQKCPMSNSYVQKKDANATLASA